LINAGVVLTKSGRFAASLAVLSYAVAGLGACGGTSARPGVVVRVGRLSISQATLSHWMSVLAGGQMVPDAPRYRACTAAQKGLPQAAKLASCRRRYRTLEGQALGFLIATDWLIGEAADRNMPISAREIDGRLRKHGGALVATARAASDAKLQVANDLAATKIRQGLEATVPKATAAEIDRYYKQHIGQFTHPEQRLFYIEEDLASRAAALTRRREFENGQTNIAKTAATLYESLERPSHMAGAGPIAKAIFSGKRRMVLGPIRGAHSYYLMEVTRISPARVARLSEVKATIEDGLASAHRQQMLARFVRAWRRKWTARTDCSSGYVVQKCRQYRGVKASEDPTPFD
jgi:hypothetical protein